MTFRWSYIIFVIVMFTFNITEFECSKKTSNIKTSTFTPPAKAAELHLGVSDVFGVANDVFRKIIGRMLANKRLVGLDSEWYW